MDLKQYRKKLIGSKEERAVSPVIGVILMVAITVILAAVIAAFVLDMGDVSGSAPSANFDYETNSNDKITTISHTSGESVDINDLTISVDGTDHTSDLSGGDWNGNNEISAGDTLDLTDTNHWSTPPGAADTVTITWESDGTSSTLAELEP